MYWLENRTVCSLLTCRISTPKIRLCGKCGARGRLLERCAFLDTLELGKAPHLTKGTSRRVTLRHTDRNGQTEAQPLFLLLYVLDIESLTFLC